MWGKVFGADLYRAAAVASNGTVRSCTSESSHCEITGLWCGESYQVYVTSISNNCESTANATTSFETVPCAPSELRLYRECSSNLIIFSWEPRNHTNFYVARAVDSTGKTADCMTVDTKCYFDQTTCGREYEFTVYAVSGGCESEVSDSASVRTAPCAATNLKTTAECYSDVLISTWDMAPGALEYTVEALGNARSRNRYNCTSFTNSCAMPGVHCGESLTVRIISQDNECLSELVLGQVAETVPCVPQNVSVVKDCSSNSILMNWEYSHGAVFYVATAVHPDGTVRTCSTMNMQCSIQGLRCGQTYSTFVIASNLKCNSSESMHVSVETAPCPPDHIEALLDCTTGSASISWQSFPSWASYTATIEDKQGGLLSCMTIHNNCTISDLECGRDYAVSVTHYNSICPSMPSNPIHMDSVPCGPENLRSFVNYTTGGLSVSWDPSAEAEGFITTVSSENGVEVSEESLDAHSIFNLLECGWFYTVKVKSLHGSCLSMPSMEHIKQVPCVPTNVTAERSCGDSSIEVMWEASRGAMYYTAIARSDRGHTHQCSSNGTVCSIPDLHCSEVYTVGVVAGDDNGTSLLSQTVTLHTVPCPPSNLHGWIDCMDNTAVLSWDASPNAVLYRVRAVDTAGHAASCENSSLTCQIGDLHCGEEYTFTVSGNDGTCQSPESTQFKHVTAPCALQSVGTHLYCDSNVLRVSWNSSAVSLNYSALVTASDGTAHSCGSVGSSCDVDSLGCGLQYTVTVTAFDIYCNGPASMEQTIQTVPCVPQSLRGQLECGSNNLTASWSSSLGASSYTATVSGPSSSESCSTPDLTCTFSNLQCAQEYDITVVANDHQCTSGSSLAVSKTTGPCEPQNVETNLHCQTNTLSVSWDSSVGGSWYTVVGQNEDERLFSCSTADTSCQLSQLECGDVYNITVLAGDSTCNSSSDTHAVIETAPCPPMIADHTLDCATNTATLFWASDEDALWFVMDGTSKLGLRTSCTTANNTCELSNLQCGQTYTLEGTALGKVCNSGPGPGHNVVTAPCAPASVISLYDCGTNIARVSWDDSLGRDTFYTCLEGDGQMHTCSTGETTCDLTLHCGTHYNVTVKAVAGDCNSSEAVGSSIETAPCPPQNVSASLMCADNTAVVTWAPTGGAVEYNVTAVGTDGDSKICQTADTRCHLPMMHCGQEYTITVTPFSETCSGFPSEAISYTAGPCHPNNVAVTLECEGNVGSVSWEDVVGAEMFVATAHAEDGHEHTCNSSSSSSCSFTDLHCGEVYTITVVTFMRGCYSDPSPGINLKSDTFYFIRNMPCGEHYTLRVISQDSVCNSSLSLPLEIDSVPCPPSDLETLVDCGSSKGRISWAPGLGGETYVVEAIDSHGGKTSCSSNSTSCLLKLECSSHYTAAVIASNDICNSTSEATIAFDSAPCLPGNVVALLDCNSNEFAVQWQGSMGLERYTALAIGSDGYRASCNTSSTACIIKDLHCGQVYSIAVVTSSVECGEIQGSDYTVLSAPCPPTDPTVDVNCMTDVATVSWLNRTMQQTNIVTAVDNRGHSFTCSTTNSSCTFDQLTCGNAYSFSIVAVTDECNTATSPTMEYLTAPCVPSFVEAKLDCKTGISLVTWDSTLGATSYLVEAFGSWGHNTSCSSSETLCSMDDLECGQDYNITVTALHDTCRGLASETVIITTGPCPFLGLEASRDCASNSMEISWTPGRGALLYNATVESSATGDFRSCTTNGSGCDLSSLQCGVRYRVSVEIQGRFCISRPGTWVMVNTAPCPPTHVTVLTSCNSNMAAVSWEMARGAVRYVAVAEDGGNAVQCNTSTTACNITGLACGRTYNVSVTAFDNECAGERSESQTVTTAPCVPSEVEMDLMCQAGLLSIAWQRSDGALRYHAVVRSSSGPYSVEAEVNTTVFFTELPCGDTYNVMVYASDEACHSSPSPTKVITAAPCPPASVITEVDCATSITTVFWDSSAHGVVYTVKAIDAASHYSFCSTSDTNCTLNDLKCGTVYNVTVIGSLEDCTGAPTPEYTVTTAPCVPVLIEVEIDCLSDSAWVVWEQSLGAELYVASAEDDHGQALRCNTTESTCSVPDLRCGEHYTFTVVALDAQCSSTSSNDIMSESAPCPPQSVRATVGCQNSTASIFWAVSELAHTYTATLERTDGETTCCSTSGVSCDVTDLPCGEMYVLTVSAEGRTCNSSQSAGSIIRTVPCTPQNLAASVSCSNNEAKATWTSSRGGQMYIVKASDGDGHTATCNSFENSCDLSQLQCGQMYNLTVVAEDSSCTSVQSESAEFKTVPCIPQNVSTDVDCASNSMSISWVESDGAVFYTAAVEDGDGQFTDCQALHANSCNVSGLSCGKIYHVTLTASDGYCTSPESSTTDAHSAPCQANHIEALMDCSTRTAFVSWYFSAGALSYTTTMETQSGHVVSCITNRTNCVISDLACGELYSVSVLAEGETCSMIAHMEGTLETEACVPLNVEVEYSMSIGQLGWDMSKGATYYSAEAITSGGLQTTCNTTDTSCGLFNMACSETYNITVTAHNHVCMNVATTDPITLITEPCAPAHIEANVDCETGDAYISWEASQGAVAYQALLEDRDTTLASCDTTDTFCTMKDLSCGMVYYIQVQAMGVMFNSMDSNSITLTTAPCVPDIVDVAVACENDSAQVTWSVGKEAVSYAVSVAGINGHRASCTTENNSCNVADLICGETYNLSLTAINDHCEVMSPTGQTFQTRPCAPLHVAIDLQCANSTAVLSWEKKDEVELYLANATKSNGEYAASCNSSGSTCLFPNLDCGETYTFTVTAYSSQCKSQVSDAVEITTGPCQPAGMSAEGVCSNDTVLLTWEETRGALKYMVIAEGNLGYIVDFATDDTTLEAQLPCGQTFSFSVSAQGQQCKSPFSGKAYFRTGPCIPQHVHTFVSCENSTGSVGWMASDGAESYTAVAVGQDSHTHMCTTNLTVCTWTDLHCGDFYVVHVIANDYLCNSMPSNGTTIFMAPCVPQNLVSSLDCELRVGTLTWNPSKSAIAYIALAEASHGHRMEVTTHTTSTMISEFHCGRVYSLKVRAVSEMCISGLSNDSLLQTEPCAPTAVTSQLDCVTNNVLVVWTLTDGAEFYTASVLAEDGQTAVCMSTEQQCGIANLLCAQNYTVSVTANNGRCDSDPSNSTYLRSAPCIPEDVSVVMDCSDNTAVVSWNRSQGALFYKVVAESSSHNSTCESSLTHCRLTNLTCGNTYTAWVVAIDDSCTTIPSERVEVQSVPCTPEISDINLDCYMDSFLVEWSYAEGASCYTGFAESSSDMASCKTNHTNCEIRDLECGQQYTVRVAASNGICNSSLSTGWIVESVPCAPQSVAYQMDCTGDSARVMWEAGEGAQSYAVHAIGWGGLPSECTTTELACEVPHLMCGYSYNITVVSINDLCNISESDVKEMQTAPCVPRLVEARVDCETAEVFVTWEQSYGATNYSVLAQGNGGYISICETAGTVCRLTDVLCGTAYSVTVRATNDVCSSEPSSPVHLDTVPCDPENISASVNCSSDMGLVTWEQGEGVTLYHVQAVGVDGHLTQCSSFSSSCHLPNLHCGQKYNLTLTAKDAQCDTSKAYLSLQSVPCEARHVQTSLTCPSSTAFVTWDNASGAHSYEVTGVTPDGHTASCSSEAPYCDLVALQCGETYNVSVLSIDDSCSTADDTNSLIRTAPCPPMNVEATIGCETAILIVLWDSNEDADHFMAEAQTDDLPTQSCNTSDTFCSMTDLPCGRTYTVRVLAFRDGCQSSYSKAVYVSSALGAHNYIVTAEGEGGYNASCSTSGINCQVPDLRCGVLYTFFVQASHAHCHSPSSSTLQIQTAPCAFTAIDAFHECHSSTIRVEWKLQEGGSTVYIATAEGSDLSVQSCNSTTASCDLTDVQCGVEYIIIVAASSDKCSSLRSPPHKISTAPCAPQAVSLEAHCESEEVFVSWEPSPVAKSYLLTAEGKDGDLRICNTTLNNCTLMELNCGQPYSFTVTASSPNCTSPDSPEVRYSTVPCDPDNLMVELSCDEGSAALSWKESAGSVQYLACAQGSTGDMLYCDSDDINCVIEGLECGAMYNFSVMASDGVCNSSFTEPLLLGAVPCTPKDVKIRMLPVSEEDKVLRVSWSRVPCPEVGYLVNLTGSILGDSQELIEVASYWTERTFFEFPLPCSSTYNVTVASGNSAGTSQPSEVISGHGVPCPPLNVNYDEDTAILSWDASIFATYYTVYDLIGVDMPVVCNTSQVFCKVQLSDEFEITASNSAGESNSTSFLQV
ncbi:hypothetical protein COCON_G00061920 [Conger conger]|uniref:Fibronectin type-III domain-containing protein n=1 Tax=Conger conger TaxID=82655 RepID=A0A9Q1I3H9_CONCO|nr:hypothetical protein COCON_G00061920 [Conger conger]